ncbi:MAG: cation-translocating P-type ATPase [Clostridiales bacterium]|jgi:Ca2+-transporting ATPase|nr:cation-translocating P-type ATPase [Clostridiales bacterium]
MALKYYCQTIDDVIASTDSSMSGLSAAEAEKRLAANGKNKLDEGKKDSLVKRFLQQLADPMIIILLAAAAVSAVTSVLEGESPADVFIILAVVIINSVLGVYQESKAEKAIEALQKMASATSKVLRDGAVTIIKSEDIVVGDVVLLEAGDAVPADGRILESASLQVEEAALTGESVPVNKYIEACGLEGQKDVPLGDRKNMVYMGSTVVYGRGSAVITATGMDTEMGRIADALTQTKEGQTPLQIQLSRLSKVLTYLVLAICAVIFTVGILRGDQLLHSFMVAVSLAVAAIPEGLVAVVTIVLSIGVTNMSRRNAIIRRLTAVETLGCAQIICSDKTGTLTQNKMTVVDHYTSDAAVLATAMALCTDAELNEDGSATGEPTEAALVVWAAKKGLIKDQLRIDAPRIGEAPFDSMRKMMSTVHLHSDSSVVQYTKGAPDEVLKRCTHIYRDGKAQVMTDKDREEILSANREMAGRALRILAAARRTYSSQPTDYDVGVLEQDLCFIGLTGMIDPVRPEVRAAIDKCRSAGIRPIMITGDHIDTAVAIAKELGIITEDNEAVSGSMLEEMTDEEFNQRFAGISVYARVQPEHKVRIVNAWRSAGYVTAMTGDGVNDAPSIKSADIGVGMGITGTDVTKNVADMVLADDNFATIVSAVEEGRRIYDNIRKVIQFLLSCNTSEVISVFFATLLGFIILRPVHLLWINLITDSIPAMALGMEKAEPNLMSRPPRSPRSSVLAEGLGFDIVYQGLIIAVLTIASYFVGHYIESGLWEIAASPDGITMAFLTLSMIQIFHSINLRSRRESIFGLGTSNKILYWAALASLALTTLVIFVPFLRQAFEFEKISVTEYAIALGLAILIIPVVEFVKLLQRQTAKSR